VSLTLAPYLALLLVVAGLTWYAVQARGDDAHEPHLHDSGVWVVNGGQRLLGRLDKSIGQLDAAYFASAVPGGGGLDVEQQGAAVVGVDRATRSLSAIDPATVDVPDGATTTLPVRGEVDLRSGTLAVADAANGQIWATRFDPDAGLPDVGSLAGKEKPLALAGEGTLLAVDDVGTVHAYSPSTGVLTTLPVQAGGFGSPQVSKIGKASSATTMTTVGTRVVLLSSEGDLRVIGGGSVHLDETHPVLQQPGPDDDSVLVNTGDRLLAVDLDSGHVADRGHGAGTPVAPVRLGPCEYAAWAGATAAVLTRCDGTRASTQQVAAAAGATLVFRVNRGQIVLNDTSSGQAWDVDSRLLTTLDDWQSFRSREEHNGKTQQQKVDHGDRERPLAKNDDFGVRPGRMTVVHPLDNDFAPAGKLLAITRVGACSGCTVEISPDGQTLQVQLRGSGGASFEYWVNDGDQSDDPVSADVRLRPSHGNGAPKLRPNYTPPELYVAAGADLDIPIARDWRDPDGDPITVDSVTTGGGDETGTANVVDDAVIRFTAPPAQRDVTMTYTVGDGTDTSQGKLLVHVQGPADLVAHPPVAEPDVVAAVQGRPVQFEPLANDLAGSDPGDPTARLELNGDVVGPSGTSVTTDQSTGEVTFRAEAAGTYLLSYQAGFGDAALSRGIIRVDVRADGSAAAPQTMPDAANLYGTDATLVDVLANDSDPSGGVLTVDSLDVQDSHAVTASIVDGRWVRVAATGGATGGKPQIVDYTVSDGEGSADGEIVLTPRPPREQAAPVTAVDRATVRAGATVTVPVLDNDASPAGDALHLVSAVKAGRAGALPVEDVAGRTAPATVGRAYVAGDAVRYVAPRGADGGTFTVSYVAANTHGETAPGKLVVSVTGNKAVNHPPTLPTLEGRASAGGTVRIVLPTSGGDPDGDPVSITGLAEAPTLGRILDVRADSILYQAYPDQTGTDEFQYIAADDHGATATGTVRVGVVGQQLPQPPQAVADEVSAAPGRTVSVDVTANDPIVPGDDAEVSLPKGQRNVSMAKGSSLVQVRVPANATGEVTAVYQLSDGAGTTAAEITVHVVKGYNNPPVVDSVFAAAGRGDLVTVDLLSEAYDPDGRRVQVARVDAPAAVATRVGSKLTVTRGARPRVIPFQIRDAGGGVAAATVYVPARTGSQPQVRSDALVKLKPKASATEKLAAYVKDSGGGSVHFTLTDRIWTSPDGLDARIVDPHTFKVTAQPGFSGPGAVSFEVATAGTTADPDGTTQVVTVPVQVGTTRPVLTCPQDPVEISQGGTIRVAVSTLCHVWTAEASDAEKVSLHAGIEDGGNDLKASVVGQDVKIAAQPDARKRVAKLHLTASLGKVSSAVVPIQIDVTTAKPPTLAPVRLGDLKAGHSRTLDLRPYFHPGIQGSSTARIMSVTRASGIAVHKVGATRVRITAAHGTSGQKRLRVTMTDVPHGSSVPGGRRVTATVSLELLDRPDRPRAPVPGVVIHSHQIHLSWSAPRANGSPIDRYRLSGAGHSVTCATTACDIHVPRNGVKYAFRVQAHNGVGWSTPSRLSRPGVADQKPGQVGRVRVTAVGNGRISLAWSKPTTDSSLDGYRVSWPGGARKVKQSHVTVTGLNNNSRYSFGVVAYNNRMGAGPARRSATAQSIGRPARASKPQIQDTASAAKNAVLQLRWGAVSPNGPGPVTYTVLHNGKATSQCRNIRATSCRFSGVAHNGSTHTFAIRATNAGVPGVHGGAKQSSTGAKATYHAVGTPARWGAWSVSASGRNGEATFNFTIPDSRGKQSTFQVQNSSGRLLHSDRGRGTHHGWRKVVGSNGVPYSLRLRVCNESGRCSASGWHNVRPYGPMSGTQIQLTCMKNKSKKLYWKFRTYGNGRHVTATVHTWINGKHEQTGSRHPSAYTWSSNYTTFPRKAKKGWHGRAKIVLTDHGNGRKGSKSIMKTCQR